MTSPAALDNAKSLAFIYPEVALTLALGAVILWDLAMRGKGKLEGILLISLTALGYSAFNAFRAVGDHQELFGGLLVVDRVSNLFRVFFAFVTALIMILSMPVRLKRQSFRRGGGEGQFFGLLLSVSLGMNLMAMSQNLLMIYLSLEMVSIISFVLAGFALTEKRSWEGALKYVIFGGVSSGIMLYGMSWIFGLTQSLHLPTILARVHALTLAQGALPEAVLIGVVCMLAGFGYKISAVPFHMWAPDVYEGSPTNVTMFFSVGPKAAGFAVMLRFFSEGLGAYGAQAPGGDTWKTIAGVVAIATMTLGNLSALNQQSVKRMLAYSSIAHAGYMLLGFCVFTGEGASSILFYILVYCLMNLGAFLVLMAVAEETGSEKLSAFAGLGVRAPFTAVLMTLFLFSLAGIPPLAGFVGKFYIFLALIKAGGAWAWTLAIIGVLNSVVSVFYYAKVARAMWLEKATTTDEVPVRSLYGWTAAALALPTVALGLYWAPVYAWVERSLH